MASTQSTEDLAFLNSGRYLEWSTQETGSIATNGVPTDGVSGVNVVDEQVVKLGITPNSGASLSFRVWLEYEGLTGFKVVGGSERTGIDYAWTQQINVSGAARLYVEITAITTGSFDVQIGRAVTLPNKVLRRRRVITDWSDLGTGILGESVVYEDGSGNQLDLRWNSATSKWRFGTTGGDWVLLEDWSAPTLQSEIWSVVADTGDAVINTGTNRLELTYASGGSERIFIQTKIECPYGLMTRSTASLGISVTPSGGAFINEPASTRFDIKTGVSGNWPRLLSNFFLSSAGSNWRFRQEPSDSIVDYSTTTAITGTSTYTAESKISNIVNSEVRAYSRFLDAAGTSELDNNFTLAESNPLVLDSAASPFFGVQISNFSLTFSGGPYTSFIGPIYVKID